MKSSQDKAYLFIKQQIISAKLKPGQRLRAQELAKTLAISRTPVREALSRLQQERFVQRNGGWGYVVSAWTLKEVLDLFKVRELLEVEAALEALPDLDEGTLKSLKLILDKAAVHLKKKEFSKCGALNRRFHLKIYSATHNELLQEILYTINDRIQWLGSLYLDVRPDRVSESVKENSRVFDALRSKKPRLVKAALLNHIRRSREGWLALSGRTFQLLPQSARVTS